MRRFQSTASHKRLALMGVSAFAFSGALAMSQAAHAQTTAADPAVSGEIVVTGSRVTNGNNSPTPVTVASVQQLLEAQPAGVIQGLDTLPALLGAMNSTGSNQNGGYDLLNLRGVGFFRGLILYDGHRVGPTMGTDGIFTGAVNVDVVPQMLLQRVDVVTGGASAVYGSDAVSGVVNFITDTKFNGLKLNVSDGISTYGDDQKTNVGIAFGHRILGDRGHFEASYEYYNAPGVCCRNARPNTAADYSVQGSSPSALAAGFAQGTPQNPLVLTQGALLSTTTYGGLINSGALANLMFAQKGVLTPFVNGTATGTSGVQIGGSGADYTGSTIVSAQQNHRMFARFDYDFSDAVHGYLQANASEFSDGFTGQNVYLSKITMGYNNPFLQGVVSPTAIPSTGTFTFSKMEQGLPDYTYQSHEYYYLVAAGLDGEIGKYKWNVDYTHTDSEYHYRNDDNVNSGHLYAALNAVVNPANGQTVCNAALVNPAAYGNCVPLNVFGPGSESAAAIAYVEQSTHDVTKNTADDVNATLSGAPVSTWAGPVNMALNGEYRHLTYGVTSDASPLTPVDCNGIQYNCVSSTTVTLTTLNSSLNTVSELVSEVSYETDIPILAGLRFAEAFNINGAVRYTDYSTSGSVVTWKIGGDWKVNDQLTLRATRSRDIRAPSLSDLYAPPSPLLKNYSDFLTKTASTVLDYSQGNPNLKPEDADTTTAGFIWRPDFVHGLSLSVDAYDISITNALGSIDASQPTTEAVCQASGGSSPLCALYVRPTPTSYPTELITESLNIDALDTYGADFEANYATRVLDRALSARLLVNWQPHLVYNNGPLGIVDVGGAADGVSGLPAVAALKMVANVNYQLTDQWSVFVQERMRGPLRQNGGTGAAAVYFETGPVPPVAYTDFTLNYNVNKSLSAYFNVQNLFNQLPPAWGSAGATVQMNYLSGYPLGDDIEGRFFTLGFRLRM